MDFRLDHVAVVVRNMEDAVRNFEENLGLKCERIEDVPTERSKVAFFDMGGPHLELVAPLSTDSPLQKALDTRGEGVHHLCLEVQDIQRTLDTLKAAGVRLVHEKPTPGAMGTQIAFLHPKSTNGVLIELVEKPKTTGDSA